MPILAHEIVNAPEILMIDGHNYEKPKIIMTKKITIPLFMSTHIRTCNNITKSTTIVHHTKKTTKLLE